MLRNTSLYKNAVRITEQIAESDNPVIKKTLEMGDTAAYHLGKMKRRLFSESETGRVFSAIRAYSPKFEPVSFVAHARTQMIPKLRTALLRYDLDSIAPLVHPTVSISDEIHKIDHFYISSSCKHYVKSSSTFMAKDLFICRNCWQ